MARPRQFDETEVLDRAIQCFWSRGYESMSVRDLASGMGITGASLYNTFGDKRSLYLRALDHYLKNSVSDRIERLTQRPPRAALGEFFEEIIERSLGDSQRKGCLLVNSALELAPHDEQFQQVVADALVRVELFFRHCIEAGQRDGTVALVQPADDLARLLLGTLLGIRVLARSRPERALLEGLVRPVFFLLDNDQPSDKKGHCTDCPVNQRSTGAAS